MVEDTIERRVPRFTDEAGTSEARPDGIANVHLLPAAPTDQDIANDLKRRALAAIDVMNAINTEAEAAGFVISYQSSKDAFGRWFVQVFQILKKMG